LHEYPHLRLTEEQANELHALPKCTVWNAVIKSYVYGMDFAVEQIKDMRRRGTISLMEWYRAYRDSDPSTLVDHHCDGNRVRLKLGHPDFDSAYQPIPLIRRIN
jgi:hypothetical protein